MRSDAAAASLFVMPCSRTQVANQPGRNARVWRYLPLDRLTDLLTTRELYLRRLDHLDEQDPDEGRWLRGAEKVSFTNGIDPEPLITALEMERSRTFVSCWTLRLDERPEMWRRIEPSSESVAIVAGYDDLIAALDVSSLELQVGGVGYFETIFDLVERFPRVNTLNLAFCKRASFREEQEVRVVYQDRGTSALSEYVRTKIDLDVLHPRVVLAPGAEPTLGNRVREARC